MSDLITDLSASILNMDLTRHQFTVGIILKILCIILAQVI